MSSDRGSIEMSKEIANYQPEGFSEIFLIIEKARENAFKAVNRELITMY